MKRIEVIAVWMMLGALLLSAGCSRGLDPTPESAGGGAIGFTAEVILSGDETKSGTLNEATAFTDGQQFRVYGRRIGEGRNTRVFGNDGTLVAYEDNGTPANSADDYWEYTPLSYWYWVNQSNYYDFLAVYPDPDGAGQSERMTDGAGNDIPGNIAVQKSYAITLNGSGVLQPGTDLLMAGTRRTGANVANRTDKVPLTFQHMLSAVKVVVSNVSDGTDLTLNSVAFHNIIHSAKAKVTIDATGAPEFSWIDTQRRRDTVYVRTSATAITAGSTFDPAAYDLLIPADLTVAIDGSLNPEFDQLPHLILTFTPDGGDPIEKSIALTDVQRSRYGTDDPLLEWEPGRKYCYNISIRLDGGVLVTVITTDWEDIAAETPGLLIE
ncbi:MAG: fimbrillin family protein [Bacteroidales bacterium]|nr:fimbrillin family protein [Bacteroidales bacterium]